jgi:hypothetical protein
MQNGECVEKNKAEETVWPQEALAALQKRLP